jgi:hypothetical protein
MEYFVIYNISEIEDSITFEDIPVGERIIISKHDGIIKQTYRIETLDNLIKRNNRDPFTGEILAAYLLDIVACELMMKTFPFDSYMTNTIVEGDYIGWLSTLNTTQRNKEIIDKTIVSLMDYTEFYSRRVEYPQDFIMALYNVSDFNLEIRRILKKDIRKYCMLNEDRSFIVKNDWWSNKIHVLNNLIYISGENVTFKSNPRSRVDFLLTNKVRFDAKFLKLLLHQLCSKNCCLNLRNVYWKGVLDLSKLSLRQLTIEISDVDQHVLFPHYVNELSIIITRKTSKAIIELPENTCKMYFNGSLENIEFPLKLDRVIFDDISSDSVMKLLEIIEDSDLQKCTINITQLSRRELTTLKSQMKNGFLKYYSVHIDRNRICLQAKKGWFFFSKRIYMTL